MSPEEIWERLEQSDSVGVFQRLEEDHPGDLYAAIDRYGRRGLVIVSAEPPLSLPDLENIEIECDQQNGGRWRTCVWLASQDLRGLFNSLVSDILEASRALAPSTIASFVFTRILRWRDLLAVGSREFALWQLRGLTAELIAVRRLFELRRPTDVIEAWQGPFGAPQDFIFRDLRIEVKAVGPTAKRIRITSADQLDVPDDVELRLTTVALASALVEAEDVFSVADLVTEIRSELLVKGSVLSEFDRRLAAVHKGVFDEYQSSLFRLDSIRAFAVKERFPRIVRSMLPDGIDDVSYGIEFAKILDFERALGD